MAGLARRRMSYRLGQELENRMFLAVAVSLKPSTRFANIVDQIQFYCFSPLLVTFWCYFFVVLSVKMETAYTGTFVPIKVHGGFT